MLAELTATLFLFAQAPPAPDTTDLYYLVFLRREADRAKLPDDELKRIQTAHMANIHSMADRGILVAAGPFDDTPAEIAGVFVFKTVSLEEAKRIAAEDPTVAGHRNRAEVYPWRAPKGIGAEYFRLHKEHPETPEDMGVQPFCMIYRGAEWNQRRGDVARLLAAHLEYAGHLKEDGKLAASGQIEEPGSLIDIMIFDRIPDQEARKLLDEDPAIKAGVFRAEYHRWWSASHVLPK